MLVTTNRSSASPIRHQHVYDWPQFDLFYFRAYWRHRRASKYYQPQAICSHLLFPSILLPLYGLRSRIWQNPRSYKGPSVSCDNLFNIHVSRWPWFDEKLRWAEGIEFVKVNMAGNEDEIGKKYNIKVFVSLLKFLKLLPVVTSDCHFRLRFSV